MKLSCEWIDRFWVYLRHTDMIVCFDELLLLLYLRVRLSLVGGRAVLRMGMSASRSEMSGDRKWKITMISLQ